MSSFDDNHEISDQVLERAIAWAVALGAEGADDCTRHAFELWLQEQPLHRVAWNRLQVVEREFGGLAARSGKSAWTSTWSHYFLRVCNARSA
jgi:transmembrane sensor